MAQLKYITVFPSTKTQTINKLITENSLTRLINRLIDVDGYVITNELEKTLDNPITTDVAISSYLDNNLPFEFSIHGYYLAVDSLSDILSSVNWNPSGETEQYIYARIFIDKTASRYPELCGQYSQTPVVQAIAEGDAFKSSVTQIENFPGSDRVIDLELLDSDSTIINSIGATSVTADGKVICTSFINNKSRTDVKTIKFTRLDYYTGLTLYTVSSETGSLPVLPVPTQLPDGSSYDATLYDYYDLNIVKYYKAVIGTTFDYASCIPLSSMNKFSAKSLKSIDGGEII